MHSYGQKTENSAFKRYLNDDILVKYSEELK